MRIETVTIEIAPQLAATLLTLQQKAEVEGKTLNTFLRELTEKYTKTDNTVASTTPNSPFEIAQHIIRSVDSEKPPPPSHTTEFGVSLIAAHDKEIKRSLALTYVASKEKLSASDWVKKHFTNGRNKKGQLLNEVLDEVHLSLDVKSDDNH